MLIIKTNDELNEWLADNYYFEEGYLLGINMNPLSIRLGNLIKGNFKAHTPKEILVYKIVPYSVIEWRYNEDCVPSEECCIEGIDVIESEEGISLNSLGIFHLIAKEIAVEKEGIVKTTFKPWLNMNEIRVQTGLKAVPHPNFWKQKLKEFGHDILFRYYCGHPKQPEELPYPNYSGYFIQLVDRIRHTKEGIYFAHISQKSNGTTFNFKNHDESLKLVWRDLNLIISSLPNAIIHCGNCEFSREEWQSYIGLSSEFGL